jgi:hypothetical protein
MSRKGGKDAFGRLPPYLTYATWQKLLEALHKHTPLQLDRSYFDELKTSVSTALTVRGTLLFLDLVDSSDRPTEKLLKLVQSDEANKKTILREIMQSAYQPILEGLDLGYATSGQLQERFRKYGAEGNIGRKCLSFFLALAKDAEINLSPSLLGKSRVGAPQKVGSKPYITYLSRKTREALPAKREPSKELWLKALLDKFPAFDPNWSEEIKLRWFDDFRELMRVSPEQKPE